MFTLHILCTSHFDLFLGISVLFYFFSTLGTCVCKGFLGI